MDPFPLENPTTEYSNSAQEGDSGLPLLQNGYSANPEKTPFFRKKL